jgi:hypothetical protein
MISKSVFAIAQSFFNSGSEPTRPLILRQAQDDVIARPLVVTVLAPGGGERILSLVLSKAEARVLFLPRILRIVRILW